MLQDFKNIRLFDAVDAEYILSPENKGTPASLHSPALDVFTDFMDVKPVTVSESMPIAEALEYMKSQHVRLLFVLDNKDAFAGIITAADAAGRKVMAFMQKNQVSRDQVQVRHIMLSKFNIKTLTYAQLCDTRVGDVMLTMKDSGDQHVVVIRVRGIISSSDISRRLKISFDIMYEAKSFAEIENVLSENGGL
jgi:CBS domain-containing protein